MVDEPLATLYQHSYTATVFRCSKDSETRDLLCLTPLRMERYTRLAACSWRFGPLFHSLALIGMLPGCSGSILPCSLWMDRELACSPYGAAETLVSGLMSGTFWYLVTVGNQRDIIHRKYTTLPIRSALSYGLASHSSC